MNVWDVSQAEHPHLSPCHLYWTSSQAETITECRHGCAHLAWLEMPQTLLPWPSFLLPVSQSQERLELSAISGEGCGFGRVLETPSEVFGWMEGNFFSLSAIPHLQNRGSCCAALTPVWSRLMRRQEIQEQFKSRVGCKGPNTPSSSTCVWKEGRALQRRGQV